MTKAEKVIRGALKSGPKTTQQLSELKLGEPTATVLQRLRRRGTVVFDKKWFLKGTVLCPHCEGRGWVEVKNQVKVPEIPEVSGKESEW